MARIFDHCISTRAEQSTKSVVRSRTILGEGSSYNIQSLMKRGRDKVCVLFRSSVNYDVMPCFSPVILKGTQHFDRVIGVMQAGGAES